MNKTFCMLPFVHSCTNVGGRNKPCCRFKDPAFNDNIPPQKYFVNDKMQKLRTMMLNGEYIEGCNKCYAEEDIGKRSYRQSANEDFKDSDIQQPKIKFIEIGLSNACNFACVTCDAQYSTTWWKDIDAINEIPQLTTKKWKPKQQVVYTDYNFDDLQFVTQVKLLGGEPFMEPRNIEFLEKLPLENITLILVTNGSVLPNKKWLDIIDRCKKLVIDISIDGMGKTAKFVRYGTDWQKIKRNMKWWYNFRYGTEGYSQKIILGYHFVIHSLNVLELQEYIDWHKFWCKGKEASFDICHYPNYLDIKFLPKKIKKTLIDKIDLPQVTEYLQNTFDESSICKNQELVAYVNKLVELRGNHSSKQIEYLMKELKNETASK